MNTYSDTHRAGDRTQARTSLLAVAILAIALTSGCSMSLVDKRPEILDYCRVSESTDSPGPADTAGQAARGSANDDGPGCATDADGGCDSETVEAAIGDGQRVNCRP